MYHTQYNTVTCRYESRWNLQRSNLLDVPKFNEHFIACAKGNKLIEDSGCICEVRGVIDV